MRAILFLLISAIALAQKPYCPVDIVIDNDSQNDVTFLNGFSASKSGQGFNGNGFAVSNDKKPGASVAIFEPLLPAATYQISIRWPDALALCTTEAKVTVTVATGTGLTVTVDQCKNGAIWNTLGIFFFKPGDTVSVSNELFFNNNPLKKVVAVDAIRFVRVNGPIMPDIVLPAPARINVRSQRAGERKNSLSPRHLADCSGLYVPEGGYIAVAPGDLAQAWQSQDSVPQNIEYSYDEDYNLDYIVWYNFNSPTGDHRDLGAKTVQVWAGGRGGPVTLRGVLRVPKSPRGFEVNYGTLFRLNGTAGATPIQFARATAQSLPFDLDEVATLRFVVNETWFDGTNGLCGSNPASVGVDEILLIGQRDSYCGDGFKDRGEQCDDGNKVDKDGCSKRCKIEEGHSCKENSKYVKDSVDVRDYNKDKKEREDKDLRENCSKKPHERAETGQWEDGEDGPAGDRPEKSKQCKRRDKTKVDKARKVWLCKPTSSATNPYVLVNVDRNSALAALKETKPHIYPESFGPDGVYYDCNCDRESPDADGDRVHSKCEKGIIKPTPVKKNCNATFGGNTTTSVIFEKFPFPATTVTVEFWILASATKTAGGIISYVVPASPNADEFLLSNPGSLEITISQQRRATSNVRLNDGLWHHVAVTWISSTGSTSVVVDGLTRWTGTIAAGARLNPGGTLVFGQDQQTLGGGFTDATAFLGELDDVRVWAVPKSGPEVSAGAAKLCTCGCPWKYQVDSYADGVDHTVVGDASDYEMHALGMRVMDDEILFAYNGNMPLEGHFESGVADKNIGLGDLLLNFQFPTDKTRTLEAVSNAGQLWAIHFSFTNDAANNSLGTQAPLPIGIYRNVTARTVANINSGFNSINNQYFDYTKNLAGIRYENTFGNLDRTYFAATPYNAIRSGTFVAGLRLLNSTELARLDLDFAGGARWLGQAPRGKYTFGFAVPRDFLPEGPVAASLAFECHNDGTAWLTDTSTDDCPAEPFVEPLVARWQFNDCAQCKATDSSKNKLTGAIKSPACEPKKDPEPPKEIVPKKCHLTCDGTVDAYGLTIPLSNFPTTSITAEFWIRSNDTTKLGSPISWAYPNVNMANGFLVHDYNNFKIFVNGTSIATGVSGNDGVWRFIAVTWTSSTGALRVYKDGKLVYSKDGFQRGAALQSSGSFAMCQDQDSVGGDFDAKQAVLGLMDGVRIYSTVLSESDIADDYLRSDVPLPSDLSRRNNLVLEYLFNECAPKCVDTSETKRNCVIGPLPEPEPLPTPPVTCNYKNDGGITRYVHRTPVNEFPATAITIEMWVLTSDKSKAGTLFSYSTKDHDNTVLLFDTRALEIHFGSNVAKTNVAWNDGKWHHLAFTWEALTGVAVLYKNAFPVWRGSFRQGTSIPAGGSITLGVEQDNKGANPNGKDLKLDPAQSFNGEIDDVRVWNDVRTAEEVRANAVRLGGAALSNPAANGLVLNWNFDDCALCVASSTPPSSPGVIYPCGVPEPPAVTTFAIGGAISVISCEGRTTNEGWMTINALHDVVDVIIDCENDDLFATNGIPDIDFEGPRPKVGVLNYHLNPQRVTGSTKCSVYISHLNGPDSIVNTPTQTFTFTVFPECGFFDKSGRDERGVQTDVRRDSAEHKGHCYWIPDTPLAPSKQDDVCKAWGGRLASFNSRSEVDHVLEHLSRNPGLQRRVSRLSTGLRKTVRNGKVVYVHVDGSDVALTNNWAPGFPLTPIGTVAANLNNTIVSILTRFDGSGAASEKEYNERHHGGCVDHNEDERTETYFVCKKKFCAHDPEPEPTPNPPPNGFYFLCGSIPNGGGGAKTACATEKFKRRWPKHDKRTNDDVRIMASVTHKSQPRGAPFDLPDKRANLGANVWLEGINKNEFKSCSREDFRSSSVTSNGNRYRAIDYIAYNPDMLPAAFQTGQRAITDVSPQTSPNTVPGWVAWIQNRCESFTFARAFKKVPVVAVTPNHRNRGGGHNAISKYVRRLTTTGMEICYREPSNFDQMHDKNSFMDYLALEVDDAPPNVLAGAAALQLPNGGIECAQVDFRTPFGSIPHVIVTVAHAGAANAPEDPMMAWTEEVTKGSFRVCAQVLNFPNRFSGKMSAFQVHWIASTCEDLPAPPPPPPNPCLETPTVCDSVATCRNNTIAAPWYNCTCPTPYTTKNAGKTCDFPRPCDEGTSNCPTRSTCTNIKNAPYFKCDCTPPFISSNGQCVPPNPCTATGADKHFCAETCVPDPTQSPWFTCQCKPPSVMVEGGRRCIYPSPSPTPTPNPCADRTDTCDRAAPAQCVKEENPCPAGAVCLQPFRYWTRQFVATDASVRALGRDHVAIYNSAENLFWCNGKLITTPRFRNQVTCGGPATNIAKRVEGQFVFSQALPLRIRLGIDSGFGLTVLLDGVRVAFDTSDLWHAGSDTNDMIFVDINPVVPNRVYNLTYFGVEGCCTGDDRMEYQLGGGTNPWFPLSQLYLEPYYRCVCPFGWVTSDGGRTCRRPDPCRDGSAKCYGECKTTLISPFHECPCPVRWTTTDGGKTCIPPKPCDDGTDLCSDNPKAACANTAVEPYFKCTCPVDFPISIKDGQRCEKPDPCRDGTDTCESEAYCKKEDTAPFFSCPCLTGYTKKDGKCTDCDECAGECGGNKCLAPATCHNNPSSYSCACPAGFSGAGTAESPCVPPKPCETGKHACDKDAKCVPATAEPFYTCECKKGLFSNDGGRTCQDCDECAATKSHPTCADKSSKCDVDARAQCTNTRENFECKCKDGYTGDGKTCRDCDECKGECGGHKCAAIAECKNTDPGYGCLCPAGYKGDGFVCEDCNECAGECGGNNCDRVNGICLNGKGGFSCDCKPGFRRDPLTNQCIDIKECTEPVGAPAHNCSRIATCIEKAPFFDCKCPAGYAGTGFGADSCVDINECPTVLDPVGTHDCKAPCLCENVPGAFRCNAQPGHIKDASGVCRDIDECADKTHQCNANAKCTNIDPISSIEPFRYWTRQFVATTSSVAAFGNDHVAIYNNAQNVFWCNGKQLTTAKFRNQDTCNGPATNVAKKIEGQFAFSQALPLRIRLGIDSGFGLSVLLDGVRVAYETRDLWHAGSDTNGMVFVDINPVVANKVYTLAVYGVEGCCTGDDRMEYQFGGANAPWKPLTLIAYKKPGYVCECLDGYRGDGVTTCEPIDPCKEGSHNCPSTATCKGAGAGKFACECKKHYGPLPDCPPIPYCDDKVKYGCDEVAICTDLAPGFKCACPRGYTDVNGDGTKCLPIDECTTGTHNCHAEAVCTDSTPGFSCKCRAGFTGDGVTCRDCDECKGECGGNKCSAKATCTNTVGSYQCECLDCYQGDGAQCVDIDECAVGSHSCSPFATCTNNKDGCYDCACKKGYRGDGFKCVDINECEEAPFPCAAVATCTNTPGSHQCVCPRGYRGNGVTCTPCNECAGECGGHECESSDKCVDTDGGYQCKCGSDAGADAKRATETALKAESAKPKIADRKETGQYCTPADPVAAEIRVPIDNSRRAWVCRENKVGTIALLEVSRTELVDSDIYPQSYSQDGKTYYDCGCAARLVEEDKDESWSSCGERDTCDYVGCFRKSQLTLSAVVLPSGATPATCKKKCVEADYPFASLRDGGVCECARALDPQALTDEFKCDKQCTADRKETCGGDSQKAVAYHSLYVTGAMSDFTFQLTFVGKNSAGCTCSGLYPSIETNRYAVDMVTNIKTLVYVWEAGNAMRYRVSKGRALHEYTVVAYVTLDRTRGPATVVTAYEDAVTMALGSPAALATVTNAERQARQARYPPGIWIANGQIMLTTGAREVNVTADSLRGPNGTYTAPLPNPDANLQVRIPDGSRFGVTDATPSQTAAAIINLVAAATGLRAETLVLYYLGRPLAFNATLDSAGISPSRSSPPLLNLFVSDSLSGTGQTMISGIIYGNTTNIAPRVYHQLAWSRDRAGIVRVMLNGRLEATYNDSASNFAYVNGLIQLFEESIPLGRSTGGAIARLRIYDVALRPDQIPHCDTVIPIQPDVKPIPQPWPEGSYCLPMADGTCPGVRWERGQRTFDTADSGGQNSWNGTLPTGVYQNDDITLNVCCHGNDTYGEGEWPQGDYCIYRKGGTCPAKFCSGYRVWDEADESHQSYSIGTICDGDAGVDTKLEFCCRTDSRNDTGPISLPFGVPFFLFRKTQDARSARNTTNDPDVGLVGPGSANGTCQAVNKMVADPGSVFWDDGGGRSVSDGCLPDGEYKDISTQQEFCHYEEARDASFRGSNSSLGPYYVNSGTFCFADFFNVSTNQDIRWEVTPENRAIFAEAGLPVVNATSQRPTRAGLCFTVSSSVTGSSLVVFRVKFGTGFTRTSPPFYVLITVIDAPVVLTPGETVPDVYAGDPTTCTRNGWLDVRTTFASWTLEIEWDDGSFALLENTNVTVSVAGSLCFTPHSFRFGLVFVRFRARYTAFYGTVVTRWVTTTLRVLPKLPEPPVIELFAGSRVEYEHDLCSAAVRYEQLVKITTTQDVSLIVHATNPDIFGPGTERPAVAFAASIPNTLRATSGGAAYRPSCLFTGVSDLEFSLEYYATRSGASARTAPVRIRVYVLVNPPTFTFASNLIEIPAGIGAVGFPGFVTITTRSDIYEVRYSLSSSLLSAAPPAFAPKGLPRPAVADLTVTPSAAPGTVVASVWLDYERRGARVETEKQTFTIKVTDLPPRFSILDDTVIAEAGPDAKSTTVTGWVTVQKTTYVYDIKVSCSNSQVFRSDGFPQQLTKGTTNADGSTNWSLVFRPASAEWGPSVCSVFIDYGFVGFQFKTGTQTGRLEILPPPPVLTVNRSPMPPAKYAGAPITFVQNALAVTTVQEVYSYDVQVLQNGVSLENGTIAIGADDLFARAGVWIRYRSSATLPGTVRIAVAPRYGVSSTGVTGVRVGAFVSFAITVLEPGIPSFTLGPDVKPVVAGTGDVWIVEWLTTDTEDSFEMSLVCDTTRIFSTQPYFTTRRSRGIIGYQTLAYAPHPFEFGTAKCTATAKYGAGLSQTTRPQYFFITVTMRDPPTLALALTEAVEVAFNGASVTVPNAFVIDPKGQDVRLVVKLATAPELLAGGVITFGVGGSARPTTASVTVRSSSTELFGLVDVSVVLKYAGETRETAPVIVSVRVLPPPPTFTLADTVLSLRTTSPQVIREKFITINTKQPVRIVVTVDNTVLFSKGGQSPTFDVGGLNMPSTGTLILAPSLYFSGTAVVSVFLTYNNGLDTTETRTFTVTVTLSPPVLSVQPIAPVIMRGPAEAYNAWLKIAAPTPVTSVRVVVTSGEAVFSSTGSPSLFLDASLEFASLFFRPSSTEFGSATFTYSVGYIANGGEVFTTPQTAVIKVLPPAPQLTCRNDLPQYTASGSLVFVQDAVLVSTLQSIYQMYVRYTTPSVFNATPNLVFRGFAPSSANMSFVSAEGGVGTSVVTVFATYGSNATMNGTQEVSCSMTLQFVKPVPPPPVLPSPSPSASVQPSSSPNPAPPVVPVCKDPKAPFLCPTGACAADATKCDPNPCGLNMVRCPDGICVASAAQCPTPRRCPLEKPVECWDGSCARAMRECPPVPACGNYIKRCEDWSCVDARTSTCDARRSCSTCNDGRPFLGCSPDRPVQCGNELQCVARIEDCPDNSPKVPPKPYGFCYTVTNETSVIPIPSAADLTVNVCSLFLSTGFISAGTSGTVCVALVPDSVIDGAEIPAGWTTARSGLMSTALTLTYSVNLVPGLSRLNCTVDLKDRSVLSACLATLPPVSNTWECVPDSTVFDPATSTGVGIPVDGAPVSFADPPKTSSLIDPSTPSVSSTAKKSKVRIPWWVWLILGLVILLFLLLLIAFYYHRKSKAAALAAAKPPIDFDNPFSEFPFLADLKSNYSERAIVEAPPMTKKRNILPTVAGASNAGGKRRPKVSAPVPEEVSPEDFANELDDMSDVDDDFGGGGAGGAGGAVGSVDGAKTSLDAKGGKGAKPGKALKARGGTAIPSLNQKKALPKFDAVLK